MKNVTITLDEKVAQWARVWAAQHNTSVSKMLGEVLAQRMRAENRYEIAMKRFLSQRPQRLRNMPDAYPLRDELHER